MYDHMNNSIYYFLYHNNYLSVLPDSLLIIL